MQHPLTSIRVHRACLTVYILTEGENERKRERERGQEKERQRDSRRKEHTHGHAKRAEKGGVRCVEAKPNASTIESILVIVLAGMLQTTSRHSVETKHRCYYNIRQDRTMSVFGIGYVT